MERETPQEPGRGKTVLTAISALALVVTLVFVIRSAIAPERDAGHVSTPDPGVIGADSARPQLVRSTRTVLPPLASVADEEDAPSVRDWLAAYWGAEWPAVRQRLEARGVDLDVPFAISAWETVEEDVRMQLVYDEALRRKQVDAEVAWPAGPLTAERLVREFGFEPPVQAWEVAEMEALAAEHNAGIRAAAEACQAAIGDAVQAKWDALDYQRAPYSTASFETVGGPGYFVGRAGGAGGWTVAIHLHVEEHPQLVGMLQGIVRLRDERDEALLRRARER